MNSQNEVNVILFDLKRRLHVARRYFRWYFFIRSVTHTYTHEKKTKITVILQEWKGHKTNLQLPWRFLLSASRSRPRLNQPNNQYFKNIHEKVLKKIIIVIDYDLHLFERAW